MSTIYPSFEFWLLIPKIIEILLFFTLGVKMMLHQKYTLNYLFASALFTWGLYIITDSIVWITAANSLQAYETAAIIRDFSICLMSLMSYLIYLTAKTIQHGTQILKSKQTILVALILLFFTIILITKDNLVVINNLGEILQPESFPPQEPVQVIYQINPWVVLGAIIPILFYFYSVSILIKIALNTTDALSKKRMIQIILGVLMIPSGIMYYIILGIFSSSSIITASIGHVIWMFSAIFIWSSQKNK